MLYLCRHGGREHQRLPVLGQLGNNAHNVFRKTHVEHAVSLVKDEKLHARKVHIAHLHMRQQASGSGYDHIRTLPEGVLLTRKFLSVVTTVYGKTAHRYIVCEPLHSTIYLLGQLVGRHHHHALDLGRGLGIGKQVDNGQQVCGGLARTRLGAGYKVVSFQNNIDALLLNGGALFKIHCIEGVQYVVAQRKFVKSHNLIIINSPAVCLIGVFEFNSNTY